VWRLGTGRQQRGVRRGADLFHLVDPRPVLGDLAGSRDLLWLGLGTTAGWLFSSVSRASLVRSDLWRLSFRLDLKDHAVRAIGRLGSWTLLVVLTNQLSLYVVLAFAFGIEAVVRSVTTLRLVIHADALRRCGGVGLGALTPQLAGFATDENYVDSPSDSASPFASRSSSSSVLVVVIVLPAWSHSGRALHASHPAGRHRPGRADRGPAGIYDFSALRAGPAVMQRARQVFFLYVLDNGLTIALCIVLGRHSIVV